MNDTVGEFSGSREHRKRRGPGSRERNLIQPVNEARQVDSPGRPDMLQMCFGLSNVARPSQGKGARALRECAFNAGPRRVKLFELGRHLSLSGLLQSLVLGLLLEFQGARVVSSMRTLSAARAGQTRHSSRSNRT